MEKKSLMSGWEQVFLIAKQCRNLWALKKVPLCKFFILLCQGLSQSACNCVCVRVCVCVHACARPSLTRWWILGGQGIRYHPPPSSYSLNLCNNCKASTNHFLIRLWHAMKSGLYTTTNSKPPQWLDQDEAPKHFPKPNLYQKRLWSPFGGL